MRWLLPRFSLRTLGVTITVACCYLSAWQHTKSSSVNISLDGWGRSVAECPAPFVVGIYEPVSMTPPPDSVAARNHAGAGIFWTPKPQVRYHFCGFGRRIPTSLVRRSRKIFYRDNGDVHTWWLKRIVIAEEENGPVLGTR